MKVLIGEGTYPAIATHYLAMLAATRESPPPRNIDAGPVRVPDAVRHPARPADGARPQEGFGMRVYVPFGREWFPYFMRRLGERPANVGFVIKSLMREG